MGYTILITGASGYLGSALCAELSRDHHIIGLYRRFPSEKLQTVAPNVRWEKGDVVDEDCLDLIFKNGISRGQPIDYVIHFAAFTGFGEKWQDEYSDTNVIGTRNIIKSACAAGVKRILFAGSIAALEPLAQGEVLTEKSLVYGRMAYSKSKAMGEKLFAKNSYRVPAIVLRLGGVFSDWCELPPLFSVMNLWSKPFVGKMVPGQGKSGFPYIHRRDVVKIVRRIVEKNDSLDRFEILFASQSGCTYQKDLFPIIRRECKKNFSDKPVNMPLFPLKIALHGKFIVNTLAGKKTYERAWMIDYVDRPLVVDTSYTRNKLNWKPSPGLHILERLPVLMYHFNHHHRKWYARNIKRNDQNYEYEPD